MVLKMRCVNICTLLLVVLVDFDPKTLPDRMRLLPCQRASIVFHGFVDFEPVRVLKVKRNIKSDF